ncbi:MAG: hypothetical protein NUW37_19270 [Planctomycetes bacterium]|nr:hypothetical protein [Planctomycetota bacterium]
MTKKSHDLFSEFEPIDVPEYLEVRPPEKCVFCREKDRLVLYGVQERPPHKCPLALWICPSPEVCKTKDHHQTDNFVYWFRGKRKGERQLTGSVKAEIDLNKDEWSVYNAHFQSASTTSLSVFERTDADAINAQWAWEDVADYINMKYSENANVRAYFQYELEDLTHKAIAAKEDISRRGVGYRYGEGKNGCNLQVATHLGGSSSGSSISRRTRLATIRTRVLNIRSLQILTPGNTRSSAFLFW